MNIRSLTIAPGALDKIDQALAAVPSAKEILYVTDPVVDKLYTPRVLPQLTALGHVKTALVEQNTLTQAMDLAESVINDGVTCVVAMGGGRVLDLCKYAAFTTRTPLLSIPTTASNDGIASPVAALKQRDGKPRSLNCAPPSILLLDPEVILAGPEELIKAGIGDTMSKFTALDDWRFACQAGRDTMNGYAEMMAQASLDALVHTRHTDFCPDFVDQLCRSLLMSGTAMEFAGSSRPVSGSEHLFSHALDYLGQVRNLHGFQVALGTVAVKLLFEEDPAPVVEIGRAHV